MEATGEVGEGRVETATSSFMGSGTRFRRGGDSGDRENKLSTRTGEGSDVLSQVQGREGVYFLPAAFLALLYTFLSRSLHV